VVFGMPKEAIRLGAVEHILSPGQIATLLCSLLAPTGQVSREPEDCPRRRPL
jgi:chemotaxis response regulator CheB